jgi:16S rRNA (adenine(1408)-N(1))-methyltransferase
MTVHFPWGSLLRGLLVADPVVVGPLAATLRMGGEMRVLLSASERDGYRDVRASDVRAIAVAYRGCGVELIDARVATMSDLAASRSAWAKRLGVGRTRSAVFARYRRARRL